jgi:hypothetical protein
VYIDNGDAGDSGEIKIDVDGHEFTEQENFSAEQSGLLDGYEVDTADGDHLAYLDTDHDGNADEVVEYDQQGDEISSAHFDADSGKWLDDSSGDTGGGGTDSPSTETGHGGGTGETISVDTANGDVTAGQATVDSGNTGTPDTAVVHDAQGDTILYTDTNHDGQADVATEISPDGHVVTAEHTGDHQWTEVETGHLDSDGQYHKDGDASGSFTPPVGPPAGGSGGGAPSGVQDTASDEHWTLGGEAQAVSGGGATDAAAAGHDGANADSNGWTGAFTSTGSAAGVVRIDASTGQWISNN